MLVTNTAKEEDNLCLQIVVGMELIITYCHDFMECAYRRGLD
jgi:hypothetical protein